MISMSETKYPIHIRIRDLRRQRSLTQEELALALGISRQSINAMETGRCLPSLPVAIQIATFFAVPLHTVFAMELPDGKPATLTFKATTTNREDMASLSPWSPLREMREALDELMDETMNFNSSLPQMSLPAANVYQTTDDVYVEVRLPGHSKEELAIEVGEDFVTVASEVEESADSRQYVRREFIEQSFRRTIALPALVRAEGATAEMKQGILRIKLPKIVEERPKTARISITSVE